MSEYEDNSYGADADAAEAADRQIRSILLRRAGAVSVRRGTTEQDCAGADYIITNSGGAQTHVDVKVRSEDIGSDRGTPDVVLELLSSIEEGHVGWTVKDSQITDLVLWYWSDTGRWVAYDYRKLNHVAKRNRFSWIECASNREFGFKLLINSTRLQSKDFHSFAVCVPISRINMAIEAMFPDGGNYTWSGVLAQGAQ